ncbi:uncharacterized protein JN550_011666 [Neoarthrinium moseri]|uniref:uncharacterized protein n=1 Tax=Neoarthrinium moseri TaxID=1658444 RepID=UPI001FDB04FA|nr:uncharacterized protein JN550_011666 [Neoarthrinium moseri]KAI1860288.1 hypothetical protein JN550_011666 [Neoarthrinium moseri]
MSQPTLNSHPGKKSLFKRAFHNKVRTGCRTCKIRRVRCDEEKPFCKRCTTTGRACDGYGTSLAGPLPTTTGPAGNILKSNATADLPLVGTGKPLPESRSFAYFLDVTAPSLAGALDTRFWIKEIPMMCQQDHSIWHAIVGLGCAHELYISGIPPSKPNIFTLQQCNLAIRSLTASYSRHSWWKALTVSTILTCICVLEGDYDQAQMHFGAGYNLLREVDVEQGTGPESTQGRNGGHQKPLSSPISLVSLRSILIGFEMRVVKLSGRRVSKLPSLLSRDNSLNLWRRYTAKEPTETSSHSLTHDALSKAITAAESLFMEMAVSRRRHLQHVKKLYDEDRRHILRVWGQPEYDEIEAYCRSFREVHTMLALLGAKVELASTQGSRKSKLGEFKKAILSLRLIHSANQKNLQQALQGSTRSTCDRTQSDLDTAICDLAEEAMSLERTYGCKRSTNSTIMNPLFTVAQGGTTLAARRRATALLRIPRTEGLWDTILSASMAEAILLRETTATQKYSDNEEIRDLLARIRLSEDLGGGGGLFFDGEIHPLARICQLDVSLGQGRSGTIRLATWWEYLEERPAQDFVLQW